MVRRGFTHYRTNLVDKLLIEGFLATFIKLSAAMRVTLEHSIPFPLSLQKIVFIQKEFLLLTILSHLTTNCLGPENPSVPVA